MNNINEIELTSNSQSFFDCFNSFIMNEDRRIFNKLIARSIIYDKIKDVPGDIVECGVFKGSGLYTFLKLKNIYNPNTSKKVIGFDFFDTENLLNSIPNKNDKKVMTTLFEGRNFSHESSFKDMLEHKILSDGFSQNEFVLIEGDVSVSTIEFVNSNPGFKISLLYLDLDLEIPTYNTLINLWERVTKGGLVVFDEYGYHKWSESKGVDKFITEFNLEIKSLNYMCPTAYIQK